MSNKIKIDIISDVVCPWCIIGYKNLQTAIQALGMEDKVEIEWQPFELNPDMPPEGEELSAHSARKYGSTPESSAQFRKDMMTKGKEVGFNFTFFDKMKIVNTRTAHILLAFANEQHKQTELEMRLFTAFFSEQKDISNKDVLIQEAIAIGLDEKAILLQLADPLNNEKVSQQEAYWHRLGVSSVPTIVFNRTSALSGAHPVETFKQALATELAAL